MKICLVGPGRVVKSNEDKTKFLKREKERKNMCILSLANYF